ncbi:phage tail tape measure protein [Algoriphagus sp. AK58]|uniref:phage tail tape measure protein n=1 Tax=Algoriphagus sp. AK58 TaxID=1406877 RepID=UPI00164F6CD9|nr:phage tail tape measure protein [Algoriphagus sp. AK58]MBC6365799.1 phage tail tape measure protein [Algoriphagus sp. AK58]
MSRFTGLLNILIGGNAENFYQAIGGVQKKLQVFQKDLDRISKDISMNISLPLSIMGGVATNTFASFEDSMLLVKAATNATEDEFKKLSETAKLLGINTKFSASQVGQGMAELAKAGWNTTQILSGVEGVLSLAAASGEELNTVTTILVDTLASFGDASDRAAYYSDILANTANLSTTDVRELGEGLKFVAPVAGALGFKIEDVALAMGLMASNGIKGSQAGTALRATLSRLVKPTAESQEALSKLGFSALNTDGSIKPLTQIIEELRGKFKDLSPAQKASTAGMLAGQEAMSGLLSLMNASDQSFNDFKSNLELSEGSAKTFGDLLESGLGGSLRRLRSSLEGIMITIGENLAPYIKLATDFVNDFSNAFNNLNPTVIKIITGFGVLLTVIPPLIVGIGGIIKIITSSIASIKVLIPLLSGISAPVLGIAVAVGAAVFLIIKYWDEIKAYFTSGEGTVFITAIKELWETVLNNIKSLISEFTSYGKKVWSDYGSQITNIFKSLFQVVKGSFDNIVKIIALGIRFITTNIQVLLKFIQGDFKGGFGLLKNYVVDVFKTIAGVVINSVKSILGVAGSIADSLGFDTISNGIDKAVKKLESFNSKIEETKKLNEAIAQPLTVTSASTVLPDLNLDTNNTKGGAKKSIRETIDSIKFVKEEFNRTTDLMGKKIEEITTKAFNVSIKAKEVTKNIQWSLGEYMDYFYQYNQSLFLFGEGVLVLGASLQNQLMNLFETGKFSFKGLIKEVGGFIAKLVSAVAIAAILSTLVGAIFGGASAIGSALSFGNIAKQLSGGLLNFGGSRAMGGSVDIGNAYRVGEFGAELFVPNQSGTIISSNDLQSGLNQSILLDGKFRIEGSDLVYLVNKENQKRGRI